LQISSIEKYSKLDVFNNQDINIIKEALDKYCIAGNCIPRKEIYKIVYVSLSRLLTESVFCNNFTELIDDGILTEFELVRGRFGGVRKKHTGPVRIQINDIKYNFNRSEDFLSTFVVNVLDGVPNTHGNVKINSLMFEIADAKIDILHKYLIHQCNGQVL
jgi:hypothetical protein